MIQGTSHLSRQGALQSSEARTSISTRPPFPPFRPPLRTCRLANQHLDATPFPACGLARNPEGVDHAAETPRFPLFFKHCTTHASVYLSRNPRLQVPAGHEGLTCQLIAEAMARSTA